MEEDSCGFISRNQRNLIFGNNNIILDIPYENVIIITI